VRTDRRAGGTLASMHDTACQSGVTVLHTCFAQSALAASTSACCWRRCGQLLLAGCGRLCQTPVATAAAAATAQREVLLLLTRADVGRWHVHLQPPEHQDTQSRAGGSPVQACMHAMQSSHAAAALLRVSRYTPGSLHQAHLALCGGAEAARVLGRRRVGSPGAVPHADVPHALAHPRAQLGPVMDWCTCGSQQRRRQEHSHVQW
jgi:hypothetical protein